MVLNFESFDKIKPKLLDEMCNLVYENNIIDSSFYNKYDVKRGLRNSNGTGVLVGLTEIGDVQGYKVEGDKKVPTEGRLLYRGIDVKDIINGCVDEKRSGYEETSYLLLFGKLPNKVELEDYRNLLSHNRDLPSGFTKDMILTAPSKNIMNKVARSVMALYSYDDNPDDTSIKNVLRQSINLIACFPTLIAYGYQAKSRYFDNNSLFLHMPKPELTSAENILRMIRPTSEYTELEAELLDLAMILHAEHGGGNNSAFTTHVISSSGTDTYSVIAAAVGSLKGPKHGGANTKVLDMVKNIKQNVKDITNEKEVEDYLVRILKGEVFDKTGLVYGMGHAVYTYSDPRAVMIKKKVKELAQEKDLMDEFTLYDTIERLGPILFKEITKSNKIISANVDLYSGFMYNALNIPIELCTPIFAAARISGWCAHRLEELVSGGRIMRPAYKNVKTQVEYKKLEER